ncbi:hypothetical protein [Bacteroides fragilis]|uniref:hypothetical protein n=1 Tax=Bacteroides thetaiotaomicron TaxID=818 RepID=UPI0029DA5AB5|nr:hypothetical protein [Bacteroides fragilis]MCE8655269.1 hypothetical protein [Bacteroides fragilis]
MMQLINVTVIKNLTATTPNGNYQIEYQVISDNLQKVSITVFSDTGEQFIGNINLENGITSCNFPTDTTVTPYFEDFDSFIAEIKAEVGKPEL